MRQITLILLFLTFINPRQSSIIAQDFIGQKESLLKLKDGTIRREIASFSIMSIVDELKTLPTIKVNEIPTIKLNDTIAIFKGDSLLIKISITKFDTTGHRLTYNNSNFLILIDSKPFYGTDGDIPTTKIKSVIFKNGKQSFRFPANTLSDLSNPKFFATNSISNQVKMTCKVFQSLDKKRTYIYMENSDGAGFYVLTWLIRDNKYITRYVDYGF